METIRSGHNMYLSIVDKMPGPKGQMIPGGLSLWLVRASYFKDLIQGRLSVAPGESGRFTFHSATQEDYVRHLAAEEKRRGKDLQWKWFQVGANHLLDATVIAFALADPECLGGIRVLADPAPEEPGPPMEEEEKGKKDWIGGRKEERGGWL